MAVTLFFFMRKIEGWRRRRQRMWLLDGITNSMDMCCVLGCSVMPILYDPMDCSLPGSSIHGDSLVKNTGMSCMPSTRVSSQPRDRIQVSHIAGRFFTSWATREALNGHELGKTLGDGEGQRALACYSSWGCKELDTTWQLNKNNIPLYICTTSS